MGDLLLLSEPQLIRMEARFAVVWQPRIHDRRVTWRGSLSRTRA